ncbi:hypothetical protein EYF80_007602 [Liparis tanakae]|uniref:Uncharacterized protein n=1 Tax=Liparis tanakae TaxID=230148 RepID=A0A4Z2IXH5_9TELE|nr:hypothetical protein EYF80_007602 [Liparis tanakae]
MTEESRGKRRKQANPRRNRGKEACGAEEKKFREVGSEMRRTEKPSRGPRGLTPQADVSALGNEGWGERDSNEDPRHHGLLPGLFKGLSSGVRTSGWEGQWRKKGEEEHRGGELTGLTGLETVPRRQKTSDGGAEGVETGETAGRQIVG